MLKKAFVILIVAFATISSLEARIVTLDDLAHMPRSIEKDYYIWRFLRYRSTTPQEAKIAIKGISHINKKLKNAYRKKTGLSITSTAPKKKTPKKTVFNWRIKSEANRLFDSGIKLITQHKLQAAADKIYKSYYKYTQRWEKDKALFWLYLLTNQKTYLDELKKSYHINIYTLLAADFTNSKYPKRIVTPNPKRDKSPYVDETDPIHWARIKAKLKLPSTNLDRLAAMCDSKESVGISTYIQARICKYTKSFYPFPYRDVMRDLPKKRQALIYAIARQESRFVPGSVSRSFALGLMQFMPFLIDHVAKQKGEVIDYDEIFKPRKAIEYADYHLDYLQKYLYHPLFIAYAYNGGIGFTKRLIKNPKYFREGAFEPYLSMERVPNIEAREYGKKVLANYVIYLNKLGIPTRVLDLINQLTDPLETDAFRKP
jgi:soluble lytic murein transglycosylase